MKKISLMRGIHIFIVGLVLAFFLGCGSSDDDNGEIGGNGDTGVVSLVILQTSDVHHHAAGYGPYKDYTPMDTSDNDSVKGGYARLAGLIGSIRSEAKTEGKPVLLVDSGDFLMGTIYDLTEADPLAFKYFTALNYDAVTLGNHEFDWGNDRLATMIDQAEKSGFAVPIIATNMITDASDAGDDALERLVSNGTIVESKMVTVTDNLKVGILGIMGIGAHGVAPLADPLSFNHDYSFLQARVDALRSAGADIVLLLSHTGLMEDGSGEDDDIAENVTGIDIIASGHEHTATHTLISDNVNGTLIFSPGSYGSYLSRLDITFDTNQGKMTGHTFELISVDDTVKGDATMNQMVADAQASIETVLSGLGVTADTEISSTDFDLEMHALSETGFGNLTADAIRKAASDLDTLDTTPYAVGVIASGVIRDNIYKGKTGGVTFSDVYNALPLGSSPYGDLDPGYPMMGVYVTAKEIRNICEVPVSVAPLMGGDVYLNFSGIRYAYDANAEFLKKVTDVYMSDPSDTYTVTTGTRLDLEDESTLYHLVVNLYALSLMDVATSVGLAVVPRDKNGTAISPADYADYRIDVSTDAGIQELKEWRAFQHFLQTYCPDDGGGIPSAIYGENGTGLGRDSAVSSN